MGFEQSQTDECVFYCGTTIFMVYTEDGILCGPDREHIHKCIDCLKTIFEMTDEGSLDEYLGVKVAVLQNGSISLTQPQLIDSILKDMGFRDSTKAKTTPALSSVILQKDEDGVDHDET